MATVGAWCKLVRGARVITEDGSASLGATPCQRTTRLGALSITSINQNIYNLNAL